MREVYFHPAIDVWQDMLQRGNLPQLHLDVYKRQKLGLYKTTKEEGLDEGKRQYISNALVNKRMSESTLFEHWSRKRLAVHRLPF